jgi:hypothetical protein
MKVSEKKKKKNLNLTFLCHFRKFYAKLSRQCADNLTEKSVLFTQELLGKMIRQGYEGLIFGNDIFNLNVNPLIKI